MYEDYIENLRLFIINVVFYLTYKDEYHAYSTLRWFLQLIGKVSEIRLVLEVRKSSFIFNANITIVQESLFCLFIRWQRFVVLIIWAFCLKNLVISTCQLEIIICDISLAHFKANNFCQYIVFFYILPDINVQMTFESVNRKKTLQLNFLFVL